jgi:hypothetical protein
VPAVSPASGVDVATRAEKAQLHRLSADAVHLRIQTGGPGQEMAGRLCRRFQKSAQGSAPATRRSIVLRLY